MEPRRHRRAFNDVGHAHELTFSCYHQFPFLKADRTCQWFCDSVQTAREQLDFDLWAYVLMPEHVHLIIRPRQRVYEIAEILQAIKEPVAPAGDRLDRTPCLGLDPSTVGREERTSSQALLADWRRL